MLPQNSRVISNWEEICPFLLFVYRFLPSDSVDNQLVISGRRERLFQWRPLFGARKEGEGANWSFIPVSADHIVKSFSHNAHLHFLRLTLFGVSLSSQSTVPDFPPLGCKCHLSLAWFRRCFFWLGVPVLESARRIFSNRCFGAARSLLSPPRSLRSAWPRRLAAVVLLWRSGSLSLLSY